MSASASVPKIWHLLGGTWGTSTVDPPRIAHLKLFWQYTTENHLCLLVAKVSYYSFLVMGKWGISCVFDIDGWHLKFFNIS